MRLLPRSRCHPVEVRRQRVIATAPDPCVLLASVAGNYGANASPETSMPPGGQPRTVIVAERISARLCGTNLLPQRLCSLVELRQLRRVVTRSQEEPGNVGELQVKIRNGRPRRLGSRPPSRARRAGLLGPVHRVRPPVGLPSRLRRSGLPSGWNGFKKIFSQTTENYAHTPLPERSL